MYEHIIVIKTRFPVTLDFYINIYNNFYHKVINNFYFKNVTLTDNNQLYILITKVDDNEKLDINSNSKGIELLAIVGLAGVLAGILLTITITNKKIGIKTGISIFTIAIISFSGYVLYKKLKKG